MKLGYSTALLLCLVSAGSAIAQEVVVEGAGYELDEGIVAHPSVGVETGVISNVFYADQSPIAAPVLRFMAEVSIASEHDRRPGTERPAAILDAAAGLDAQELAGTAAPTVSFRLGGRLAYQQYLHTNDAVSRQNNLSAGLNGHLEVFPEGEWSVLVDESFVRDTRPRNFESLGNLNRVVNHLRLFTRYHPGKGALELRGGLQNWLDVFESEQSAFANRMNTLLSLRAEWQFLPITRLFFDTSYGFFGGLGASSTKVSSNPLRIQLGVATAITPMTTVRSHVGFGDGFYAAGPNFSNVLLGTELGLRYSPLGRVTVAYEYDFQDSINANFYRDHALVARVDQQIHTILLDGGVQLRLRSYRGLPMEVGGAPARSDVILRGYARGQYLYRDWLAFTGMLDMVTDQTDFISTSATGTDNPSYTRVDFHLGAVAAF